ncbi:MAG: AAA family ATPase [Myxococcota bacterium]
MPRLDLHVFVKNRRRAWENDAGELIAKHFERLDESAQLALRLDAQEWLEVFRVDVEPPSLTRFVGKYAQVDVLPLPADEEEERSRSASKRGKPPRPPTPTLARIGVNLNTQATNGELERAHGRDDVVERLLTTVASHRVRQGIVLVGPTGVGKTTIANELAHRIAHETADTKEARPVYFVDASRLVAGENWFGDWQRQTLDVLQECEDAEVVWFVGNLLPLLDAGKNISSEQNVAMLLKPALAGRRLWVIGECSDAAWAQLSLRDAGFARLFTPFRIEEPPSTAAHQILSAVVHDLRTQHSVDVEPEGLSAVQALAARYTSDGSQLGTAAHMLRRIVDTAAADGRPKVDRSAVVSHFCKETGLPEFLVRDDVSLPVDHIRQTFQKRLIGQDHAIDLMTDLVTVIKAGLSDFGRPLGSFLFVGPTGVGKTETAKALANFLFGSENRMTRFDMSEFSGWDAVHRFLGGRDQEGKLVAAVRRRPFSVVLLDEIEKASPAIFDVLLQVLGEARLTDEAGRTADFKNVVVIMTSNLGVDTLKRAVGFQTESVAERYQHHFIAEAQKFFRPELFNRIDHIVPFMPLGKDAIRAITVREIDKFLRREGLRQRDLTVDVDDDVLWWLAAKGIDERYGARPLKRVLEQQLTSNLARTLAEGLPENVHRMNVRTGPETLTFESVSTRKKSSSERQQLKIMVQRVQNLRFRHRCWKEVPNFREAERRIALIDRLSQHKQFWDDQTLAEARLAGVQTDRRMVEALNTVGDRIDALDDLAHEAYFSRDQAALPDLLNELTETTEALQAEELALHARGLDHPDAVTLFFTPGKQADRLLERIAGVYLEMARHRQWRVSFRHIEMVSRSDTGKNPGAAAAKAKQKKDEPPPVVKKMNKKAQAIELKWLQDNPRPVTLDDDASVREAAYQMNARFNEHESLALYVEGPFAGALLLEEAGQHLRIDSDGTCLVHVRARPGVERTVPELSFLQAGLSRLRVIDERRNIIEDDVLQLHAAYEPRIWRVYERFMRARPFRKAFGEKGMTWFKAWEADTWK